MARMWHGQSYKLKETTVPARDPLVLVSVQARLPAVTAAETVEAEKMGLPHASSSSEDSKVGGLNAFR